MGTPRTPLSAARLTGRRLLVHRAVQTTGALFALVALVTVFLPWDAVWVGDLGGDLGCMFRADCHPTPGPTAAERMASPPDRIESGIEHFGPVPAAFFLLFLAGRLVSLARPRFWSGMAFAGVGLLAVGLAGAAVLDFKHLFDTSVALWGKRMHEPAAIGLAAIALLDLMAQPILYLGARVAAPVTIPVPAARVVARR